MNLIACLLAAGEATAEGVALKGGMSFVDGSLVNALLIGVASIISACGGVIWVNRRYEKKRQRPLDTDDTWVTHGECKAHRCALEKRIDELGPALNRIFKKLAENDQRSEDRAEKIHRRMDPLIEKIAATSAKVEEMGK